MNAEKQHYIFVKNAILLYTQNVHPAYKKSIL